MVNTSTRAEHTTSARTGGTTDPRELVTAAVTAANFAAVGAPFDPLLIKFANPGDFQNGWSSDGGDTPIAFYRYNGNAVDNFRPLGDYAVVANAPIAKTPIMLVAPKPGHEDALAHPTGFEWILDDKGSGNDNDLAYFWPQAPSGYQALGICVGFNGQGPVAENYWCVRNDYLQSAPTENFWGDAGQGWKSHNGDLSAPSLTNIGAGEKLLLAPTTILSDEYRDNHGGATNSYCLALDKLFLPVPGAAVGVPDYQPEYGEGTETPPGLENVAVLPCLVMDDPGTGSDPSINPFYYLAGQPYWVCTRSFPSPEGGKYTENCTIGTSTEASNGFQNTTSLTVGADVGIEAGPVSTKMSVSYTREMQVSANTSIGHSTQTSTTVELNLEAAKRILIWQKQTDFVAYRTTGDALSQVMYQTADIYFTDSNSTAK